MDRAENLCYVMTVGRRTGRPHMIEIWFGARTWQARARAVVDPDEEAAARRLLASKYQP